MKALIQRVKSAKVEVEGHTVGEIEHGLLVFLGIEKTDTPETTTRLASKVTNYRVFEDHQGKMNLNVLQTQGQCLVVSQFTLVADTTRGNRPSFSAGADHQLSQALYQQFIQTLQGKGVSCESGQFAADMQVSLQNDGPVTFLLSA